MSVLGMALASRGFEPLEPMRFYREIFPDGELDVEGAMTPGKYTAIAVEITRHKKANGKPFVRRYSVTDDLNTIDELLWSKNFCILAPISYAGKSRDSRNARIMYALVVELDNLIVKTVKKKGAPAEQKGLDQLIRQWSDRVHWIPRPTYTIASGNGLHLYYLLERPVPLFPNIVKELKSYKRELTAKIWNRNVTTSTGDAIQQESIFQGFRMVGGVTKNGDRVTAYRTGEPVTLAYLNEFVSKENRITEVYKSKLTLAEAKDKYPDWYENRIVEHQPKGNWATNRNVYEWWKRRITAEAVVGHRYYCLLMLTIYAIKCSKYDAKKNPHPVKQDELERDCMDLLEVFDNLSNDPENPFTEKDVADALQAWEDRGLYNTSIESIANRSGLTIEKNRRNYRKQADHVKIMNAMKAAKKLIGESKGDGRPAGQSKERDRVLQYRAENPNAKPMDCVRDIGISKNTVYRWWKEGDPHEND